jgi:hypothetical protein
MLAGSATAVIAVTLLAIHALDDPYRKGVGELRPVAMERTLELLTRERALVGDRSPLPCDARGAARS